MLYIYTICQPPHDHQSPGVTFPLNMWFDHLINQFQVWFKHISTFLEHILYDYMYIYIDISVFVFWLVNQVWRPAETGEPAPNFLEPLWPGAAALAHVPWRWKMPWIWRSNSGITDLNCFILIYIYRYTIGCMIYIYVYIYIYIYIYIDRYRYQYMQTYIYIHTHIYLYINVPLVNIAMDLETGLEPLFFFFPGDCFDKMPGNCQNFGLWSFELPFGYD